MCGLIKDPRQGRSGKSQEFFAGFPARPGPGKIWMIYIDRVLCFATAKVFQQNRGSLLRLGSVGTRSAIRGFLTLLERCIPADFFRSALQQHPFHDLCSLSVRQGVLLKLSC